MKMKGSFFLSLIVALTPLMSGCEQDDSYDHYYQTAKANYTYYDYSYNSSYGVHYLNSNSSQTQNILVIPTIIKGYENNATEENRLKIEKAFFGESGETGWESVKSYYEKSSFGNFKMTGEVTAWFDLGLTPEQLYAYEDSEYQEYGTFYALEQAYLWAANEQGIDLEKYDNDNDGYVDAIILIYSAPNYTNWKDDELGNKYGYWAFTYWDYNFIYGGKRIINDETGEETVAPHGYCWMSYDFMDEGKGVGIDIDTHTYIHEFGHILGLDDYYDTDYGHAPMGYCDMMDGNIGEHNAFTKYALGWVEPYVVTGNATITIGPSATTGDCIILRNNASNRFYDNAFNEYLILELITPTGLWEQDSTLPYYGYDRSGSPLVTFTDPGIRVLHVDGRLYSMIYDGVVSNPVYHRSGYLTSYCSNTPSRSIYQTGDKTLKPDLVSLIACQGSTNDPLVFQTSANYMASSNCLFTSDNRQTNSFDTSTYKDFFLKGKMHDGSKLGYSFTIDSLTAEGATITFKKG